MNYLAKSDAISTLQGRDLDDKVMDCLGGVSARFPSKDLIMFHKREGLHLCEHDSMIWDHFCLIEFLMLWRICALSSCICGSDGEEERRASLSMVSRLVISVRLGIVLC